MTAIIVKAIVDGKHGLSKLKTEIHLNGAVEKMGRLFGYNENYGKLVTVEGCSTEHMEDNDLIGIILATLGAGLTITITLVGILFSWLKSRLDKIEDNSLKRMSEHNQSNEDRFRSIYHELRDIRSRYDGLLKAWLLERDKE